MPEGPEVKTIVEELNNRVVGNTVKKIVYAKDTQNLLVNTSKAEFEKLLLGQKIINITRVGKYINIEFEDGVHVIFHLLITGRLSLLKNSKETLPKYFRFAFVLSDEELLDKTQSLSSSRENPRFYPRAKGQGLSAGNKSFLCLGDMRKWTRLYVVSSSEFDDFKYFKNIGIDVFSSKFTVATFKKILNTPQKIYTLLLDQKKISGLGNIYVNEVLFKAKIHPKTQAKNIPEDKIVALHKEIINIVNLAYKEKGTTIMSFLETNGGAVGWHTLNGSRGGFWKYVKIFQHEGKPCPACGSLIKRDKIGGRSAFFCDNCQSDY